jgi:SAM-dependent methyltransferase
MPTWEARVSRATAPADRVDAELRYAFAAPLVRDAALWVDLGCGTGVAAGAALGGGGGPAAGGASTGGADAAGVRTILVDKSGEALGEARRECGTEVVAAVEADLETAEGIAAVRAAIAAASVSSGAVLVTCLDVLAQLADVTALVALLVELGERATVVLSVPDDAAGALEDPHRVTAWSASAAEELRRLLPAGTLVARQVAVRASAIVVGDGAADGEGAGVAGGQSAPLGAVAVGADQPAAHHLLAFGPDTARLRPVSGARVANVDAERTDARRRESDLAFLEARVAQLESPGAV